MARAIAIAAAMALAGASEAQSVRFFDDGEHALWAIQNAEVQEPSIPLFYGRKRVGEGEAEFDIVECFDRVPGTDSFPLTLADIVANGYVRPLVQQASGTTSSIGTSIVSQPGFRVEGEPIDIVPDMLRGDARHVGKMLEVTGIGRYGGRATIASTRSSRDQLVGQTRFAIDFLWRSDQPLDLADDGEGFDAFRLCWLSSMLADTDAGIYDARYLSILSASGPAWTIEIDDERRGRHLFAEPREFGVGDAIVLRKDSWGTWNPGSPSIELRLVSLEGPIGRIGVQGYLAQTQNPNDDSLNVWFEWLDAPDVVPPATVIRASFEVVATDPTDPPDTNHDHAIDRKDAWRVLSLRGRTPKDEDFDSYADLDRSGVIDAADYAGVLAMLAFHPADIDQSNAVDGADFFAYLDLFAAGDGAADITSDGSIDASDFFAYLDLFASA